MGNSQFLSLIKDKPIVIDQSLLNCSSSKLREYYSSYKSICESFSITINQFIQIFGHNQKAFQAFDPKKKGRIDAIQMFTALILFSGINYQQKIKFLFQIFDFNEEGWLSYEAVIFLIINACNATYKIYSISQTINSRQIETFLNEYFYQQSQIKLESFLKWSRKIDEFMVFFNTIEQDFEPYYELKKIDKIQPQLAKEKCSMYKKAHRIENYQMLLGMNQKQGTNNGLQNVNYDNSQLRQFNNNLNDSNVMGEKTINNNNNNSNNNNTLFDSDFSRIKNSEDRVMMMEGHHLKTLEDEKETNPLVKKIKKSKYKINFQFDTKFIDTLSTLVAPQNDEEGRNNEQNQNSHDGSRERMMNEREVNFYFQNSGSMEGMGIDNDEIDDDQYTEEEEIEEQTFNPLLKWLYGINVTISNPIKFLQTSDPRASNQIFIYTLNHIVILFYPKINIQRHYTQHKNNISTFQISKNKNYIVSADYGEDFEVDFPEIHVWRVKDRRTVLKWKNTQQKGKIHKLAWIREDRNIVSVSYYENKWTLKIIDVLSHQILLSTYILPQPIQNSMGDNYNVVASRYENEHRVINILQCQNSIKLASDKSIKKCLLVYTHDLITYLIPNQSLEGGDEQLQMMTEKKIQYSVVTKYLNDQGSFSAKYNNNMGRQSSPFSNSSNNNQWGQKNDTQNNIKYGSHILQIQEFGDNKFLCVHNDRKVRLWDGDFQNYEILYQRDTAQKPLIKAIIVNMVDENDKQDGENQNEKLRNKNDRKLFAKSKSKQGARMSSSLTKHKDTSGMLTNLASQNKKYTQQQQDQVIQNLRNKLIIFLDEQKLQLLSPYSNKSVKLQIPSNLFNLMFIDAQLISTKKHNRELLMVSLFGDLIRVIGMEKLMENFFYLAVVERQGDYKGEGESMGVNKARVRRQQTGKHGQQQQQSNNIQQNQNEHLQYFDKFRQQQHNNEQPTNQYLPIDEIQKLITYKKYYQLFVLQKCKDYHSHEEHDIIIANNLLYKINADERELVTLMCFDYELKAISAHGEIYALLTENDSRYIYLIVDQIIVEKIKLVHEATTFKLISSHLIVCSEKFIEVYTKSYDKYFSQQSRKIQIDSSAPVDISSTQNPFKYLITTQDRELYYLQIKNYDFKYKKIKSLPNNNVTNSNTTYGGQYNSSNLNINNANNTTVNTMMTTESYLEIMYPYVIDSFCMIFYPQQKFVCLGMTNGEVRVWEGARRIRENKEANQQYYQLTSHYGPVQRLKLKFFLQNLQLITIGRQDGMVIIYDHRQYLIGDKDKPIIEPYINNNNNNQKQPLVNYRNHFCYQNYFSQITMFNNPQNSKQTALYNQNALKYSLSVLKDSQLQVALFEDTLPAWVQKIITNIVHPSTSNYEPLVSENEHIRANLISLQISHVYGLLSQKTRNTAAYIHHYATSELEPERFQDIFQNIADQQTLPTTLSTNKQAKLQSNIDRKTNKVLFSDSKLLPLNEQHENCKREIIYFIDRLIVLVSPETKNQRVYGFHNSQVTCFQVHPNKRIVCSAERSISKPVIHIWDAESLVMMRTIKTRHKGGSIYRVEFSRQGTFVLTLSGCSSSTNAAENFQRGSYPSSNKNFNTHHHQQSSANSGSLGFGFTSNPNIHQKIDYISIEIIEWEYSNSVLHKILFHEEIYGMKFNPYCESEICLGGRDSLKVYSFQMGNLVIKETLTEFGHVITALAYSSALYGNDIESDIILGTLTGDVLLYVCGKLITVKKIHQSSINFIQLNEIFKYKTIIVTGAQDSMVKVWDMKFNLLTKLNCRQELLIGRNVNDYNGYNFSPQSVDFYSCYSSKMTSSTNAYILLISTRSGHILESKLANEYQGLKSIENEKVTVMKEKLSLETKVVIRNNSFIDEQGEFEMIGEKVMVTYCVGSSVIVLWNIEKNQYLSHLVLRHCPSTIKYNQQQNKLYIGYYKTSEIDVYTLNNNSTLQYFETFGVKNDYYPDNIVFCAGHNLLAVSLVLNTQLSEYNGNNSGMIAGNMSTLGVSGLGTCVEVYEYKEAYRGEISNTINISKGLHVNYNPNSTSPSPLKKQYELKYRIDLNKKRGPTNTNLSAGSVLGSVWMEFSSTGQELLVLYGEKKIIDPYNFALINNNYFNSISKTTSKGNTPQNNNSINPKQTHTIKNQYIPVPSIVHQSQFQHLYTVQHAQKLSKSSQFILYNIIEKKQKQPQQQSMQEFVQLNFYPFLKVNYLYHQKMLNKGSVGLENREKIIGQDGELLHPVVTQMAQFQKFIVVGTSMGELVFVHSDYFCALHRKLYKPTEMYKYFKLFSSPITKIVAFSDRLIVSSAKKNSIISIKVINNQQISITIDLRDDFNEKITEQYLQKLLKLTFPKRKYIYESRFSHTDKENESMKENKRSLGEKRISKMKNIKTYKENEISSTYQIKVNNNELVKRRISLELQSVIGRNAMYKRNNIFIDLRENIISHTGCNLVILKRNTNPFISQQQVTYLNKPNDRFSVEDQRSSTYTQQFLKLDMTPFSTFAEISSLTISEDRRMIYAGTNEENAKILIWDISTRTHIKQISFKDIVSIRKLAVSSSNNYLAVIALGKKGDRILFFIDVTEENILAAFTFSPQHSQINDIKFFPNLQFVFLLCGNNYMAEWRYNGQLTFEHYNIENPSDFNDTKQKTTNNMVKSESNVIFYSLTFLKNILISAGSDGYLYIWNDKRIIKKQNAHPKSAILCLYASSSSRIFASGGADGKAIVWQLSSSSIIQKIFEFSIYHGRQQKIPIRYHIQSVCISKNNIIVGTRSGEVYQFLCNDIEQIQKLKQEWKKGINLILPAFDDDTINSISFNTSSQKLFIITQSGCFSVFDLASMQKVREQKIDIGKSEIIKMIVCKLSYRIFVILKNSVISYYYLYNKEEKVQKFRKGKETLKADSMSFIKNAIMSANEKYLALLMASAQMDLYSIQLYDLSQPQGQFFKQYKILDHIPTNVTVIDFSTDNQYLICKNTQDQQTIIHLSTHEIINPNSIEFQLQYSDEAKKTSKNIRDVLQLYGEENQLLKIAQVMNHSIIATDQMGSIRVYEYPIIAGNSKDKQDISHYGFYVDHLNEVYLCVLSQDSRLLATVGREDRSLFLWKVKEI